MAVMSGIVSRNPQTVSHTACTSGGPRAHTNCALQTNLIKMFTCRISPERPEMDVRLCREVDSNLRIKKAAVQTFTLRFWVWRERAAAIVCWAASPAGLMENCQHQDNRPRMSQNWQARRRVHVNCRRAPWLKREISYLCKTDITNGQSGAWEDSLGTIWRDVSINALFKALLFSQRFM